MTADDPSGTVAIFKRGRYGLYADDHGLTVRHLFSARRFAWAEVSCFEDGTWVEDIYSHGWVLYIVLRTGRKLSVRCKPTPEILTAVRQVAARYRIPTRLVWAEGMQHGNVPTPLVGVVPQRRVWVPKRFGRIED